MGMKGSANGGVELWRQRPLLGEMLGPSEKASRSFSMMNEQRILVHAGMRRPVRLIFMPQLCQRKKRSGFRHREAPNRQPLSAIRV